MPDLRAWRALRGWLILLRLKLLVEGPRPSLTMTCSPLCYRTVCNSMWFLITLPKTLVSGYLRMVYSISDDHRLMCTIHPSEPILASVAAEQMRKRPHLRL